MSLAQPPVVSSLPQALLLVTSTCAHCAAMKIHLNKLQGEGLLAGVEIIDVVQQPDVAQQYGVKSVPWLKLGPIHLLGAQSESAIRQWLYELSSAVPATQLFVHLLETDALDQVIELVKSRPALLTDLLPLIADPELDFKIRLGVSAVIETLAASDNLTQITPQLVVLSHHAHERVRADVAYFLGLIGGPAARQALEVLAKDANHEVREIAAEGLQGNE